MEHQLSIRHILTIFFRQKATFLIVFLVVALAGLYALGTLQPRYEARGAMLIKFGQGALPALGRGDSQRPLEFSRNDRDEYIQSNIQILQSTDLLMGVMVAIGPERMYPGITRLTQDADSPAQAALRRLREKDLKITNDSRSDMIEVHVYNENRDVAIELTQRLMDMFISRHIQVYGAPKTNFIEEQVADAQRKLAESQRTLESFKAKNGISVIDGETAQLLQEKSDLAGRAYEAMTDAQAELDKLENEASIVRSTYRPDNPIVMRLENGIATARRQVEERNRDLNAGKGGALGPKTSAINKRIATLESHRSRYNELSRQLAMDEENLKYYQQRNDEARMNEALNQQNITRISVVDKPGAPLRPAGVSLYLMLAAILMTSGLLATAAVILKELLSDRIAYPGHLADAAGIPVLATFAHGRSI